jgi:hypothetical protein
MEVPIITGTIGLKSLGLTLNSAETILCRVSLFWQMFTLLKTILTLTRVTTDPKPKTVTNVLQCSFSE